jgi:hypothetical protein
LLNVAAKLGFFLVDGRIFYVFIARRTDAKLRVGKWKPFKDDQGKGFKNAKTGQVVRAKK